MVVRLPLPLAGNIYLWKVPFHSACCMEHTPSTAYTLLLGATKAMARFQAVMPGAGGLMPPTIRPGRAGQASAWLGHSRPSLMESKLTKNG
jgi:hypothetical protein